MTARWVLQKLLKIKQGKRKAYLKKPRSSGVDQGKIAAHEVFQNRSRVNTTQGKSHEMLPVLDNTWTKDIPQTKKHSSNAFTTREVIKHYYDWNSKGELVRYEEPGIEYGSSHISLLNAAKIAEKKEQLHLIDHLKLAWQSSRRTGVSVFHTITLKAGTRGSLKAYFSGNEWLFVIETATTRFISKVYNGREEAMAAYEGKRIFWNDPINK